MDTHPSSDLPPRFRTDLGNDDLPPGADPRQGRLRAFDARHRFAGRTWSITVWAVDLKDAETYCRRHGLTLAGQIEGVYEA